MEKSRNVKDYKLYGFIQLYIFQIKTLKFTKLMIFMQYNAPNLVYVYQHFSGAYTLHPGQL